MSAIGMQRRKEAEIIISIIPTILKTDAILMILIQA
jgi:hypothetical protein